MNKKYIIISVGILVVALALLLGFLWYTKTSNKSDNQAQAWATYIQRLDSGDVISMDYPTELTPVYGPYYGPTGEWKSPAYVLHFYARDNTDARTDIVITQSLSSSKAEISNEKSAWSAQSGMKQSRWHIGEWTAYESLIPSLKVSLDTFYFNINDRDLSMEISASEMDIERIMSSIKLNGIHMLKLDSMQGWDWPALKTSK